MRPSYRTLSHVRLRPHLQPVWHLLKMRNTSVSKYRKLELCSITVAALAILALIVTYPYNWGLVVGRTAVQIGGSSLTVAIFKQPPPNQGWYTENVSPANWRWAPQVVAGAIWGGPAFSALAIPIWYLAFAAAVAAMFFHHKARPKLPGQCRKCDYDLTGNVSGVCPECGTKCDAKSNS